MTQKKAPKKAKKKPTQISGQVRPGQPGYPTELAKLLGGGF